MSSQEKIKELEKRYTKFLLEKEPEFPKGGYEGLNIVPTGISEDAKLLALTNYYTAFGAYTAITELFDCQNIMMCSTGYSIFFSIPQEGWHEYTHAGPEIESPKLDRHKLENATPDEIIGAIIDLILDRKNWNHKVVSKELKLS